MELFRKYIFGFIFENYFLECLDRDNRCIISVGVIVLFGGFRLNEKERDKLSICIYYFVLGLMWWVVFLFFSYSWNNFYYYIDIIIIYCFFKFLEKINFLNFRIFYKIFSYINRKMDIINIYISVMWRLNIGNFVLSYWLWMFKRIVE